MPQPSALRCRRTLRWRRRTASRPCLAGNGEAAVEACRRPQNGLSRRNEPWLQSRQAAYHPVSYTHLDVYKRQGLYIVITLYVCSLFMPHCCRRHVVIILFFTGCLIATRCNVSFSEFSRYSIFFIFACYLFYYLFYLFV